MEEGLAPYNRLVKESRQEKVLPSIVLVPSNFVSLVFELIFNSWTCVETRGGPLDLMEPHVISWWWQYTGKRKNTSKSVKGWI